MDRKNMSVCVLYLREVKRIFIEQSKTELLRFRCVTLFLCILSSQIFLSMKFDACVWPTCRIKYYMNCFEKVIFKDFFQYTHVS